VPIATADSNLLVCRESREQERALRMISCPVPVTTVIHNANRLFVQLLLRCSISSLCVANCRNVSLFTLTMFA